MIGLRIHPTGSNCITIFFELQYPISIFAQIGCTTPEIDRIPRRLQEVEARKTTPAARCTMGTDRQEIAPFPSICLHHAHTSAEL